MAEKKYSQDSTFAHPTVKIETVLIGFLLVVGVCVVLTAGLTQYQRNALAAAAAAAAAKSSASSKYTGVTVVVHIEAGAGSNSSLGFSPRTITVVAGKNSSITWTNGDYAVHTVTSNTDLFDSGNINPGTNFTNIFTTPGTYHYHCSFHPWMTGTVVVLA
ncbi:MAG TPA: cupredoxin domain-containing protein [Nitrososphaerales archaeon]|nr:cupredoxin domain-containing protein [Nitrososphaerales archaeon]